MEWVSRPCHLYSWLNNLTCAKPDLWVKHLLFCWCLWWIGEVAFTPRNQNDVRRQKDKKLCTFVYAGYISSRNYWLGSKSVGGARSSQHIIALTCGSAGGQENNWKEEIKTRTLKQERNCVLTNWRFYIFREGLPAPCFQRQCQGTFSRTASALFSVQIHLLTSGSILTQCFEP